MRLYHPILSSPIHWVEGTIPVLVVEHPVEFRNLVFELSMQAEGEDGSFILSLDYETLDCGEHLHVIRDYVDFPLDDRKLQNQFQKILQIVVREDLAPETDHLQNEIAGYLAKLITQMEYPVTFSSGDYVLPLLKSIRCQPVLDGESPMERLMQYIELYSQLMHDQCFALVNGHIFFSAEELQELYKMANYRKWKLLLMEHTFNQALPGETVCLIDQNFCELRLDSGETVD